MYLYNNDLVSSIYLAQVLNKTVFHVNQMIEKNKIPYVKKEWRFIESGAMVGAFYWLDKAAIRMYLKYSLYVPTKAMFGLNVADDYLPFSMGYYD